MSAVRSSGISDERLLEAIRCLSRGPAPLIEQLRVGGHLVQPIGPDGQEEVVLFERTADGLQRRQLLTFASFVRLHGQYACRRR